MWKPGDRLCHRYNPDLGPGRVVAVDSRRLRVEFPDSVESSGEGEILTFGADSDALAPLELAAGSRARVEATGEVVTVEGVAESGLVRLAGGRELALSKLWPLPEVSSPVDLLARGEVGAWEDFLNRLDGLRLRRLRQADGLGSFLGGRIRLYPHQLYVAERACRRDPARRSEEPVRWLLADEVGLGKTVEACLIMNRLIHTGRAERTLVVAPDTLTVQWLGELWRKHHQVFVLLDDKRLRDVERDFGPGFNPFEVHRRAIIASNVLSSRRRLAEQAVEAEIDLLVVDEAHRLKRPPGHPGNEAYRAIESIAALGKSVLLLTATPLEDDAHGFFRLLQLLRPDDLPEDTFEQRLERRVPLPPCTSATRRVDVGGLPPRLAVAVDLDRDHDVSGWALSEQLERLERRRPAIGAAARRRKVDRVFRALASPAALEPLIARGEEQTAELAARAGDADPRLAWIADAASGWRQRGEKTLVFVAHRESLERLKSVVERRGRERTGIFHQGLSARRRDLEVAQFRLAEGPSLLISTECGGEGRNFEFCHRLVLFDLPWKPAVIEQRIGRLDRIGRTRPTEIVYFRPPGGLGRAVVRLYEAIGLFVQPLGGLERELRHVARAIASTALDGAGEIAQSTFDNLLREAREANARVRQAAYHELHREPFRRGFAAPILARVPADLDTLNQRVVLRAAARLGFEVEQHSGKTWQIEHGAQALVDHLPGVPAGASFLGTFDRASAVADESIDFFAAGHPLVEGILAELEDGRRGRTALLQVAGYEEVLGLLAVYRRGPDFELVAVDAEGLRQDLAESLAASLDRCEPVNARRWTAQASWPRSIRRLAAALPEGEPVQAVAVFRIRRR